MFTKTIRTSALVSAAAAFAVAVVLPSYHTAADQPGSGLRPVPPMRSVPQPLNNAGASNQNSRPLGWRASEKVSTPPVEIREPNSGMPPAELPQALIPSAGQPLRTTSNSLPAPASDQRSVGQLIAATGRPSSAERPERSVVAQVAYTQDTAPSDASAFAEVSTDGMLPPRVAQRPKVDPFADPFGDMDANRGTVSDSDRLIIQPPADAGGFTVPEAAEGNGFQPPGANEFSAPAEPLNLAPTPSPFNAPSTPQALQSPSDDVSESSSTLTPPSSGESYRGSSEAMRDDAEMEAGDEAATRQPSRYISTNCDDLRSRIASRSIRDITLDISPPFRPDLLEKDDNDKRFAEVLEAQLPRDWRDLDGNLVANGRFVGLAYENAIIETSSGTEAEISLSRLSEPDLEYITDAWFLPSECQLPNIAFQPRQWLPTTMTWKASGLCHKPLYFEEVNLERYGQTAGPFAQPVLSTAHFFVNIAVLPYKMGIHPPTECQYALGYYRPGNCAPWIIPPVPISLRGALFQAGAVGAGIALIP
jgi:hypothetical protein